MIPQHDFSARDPGMTNTFKAPVVEGRDWLGWTVLALSLLVTVLAWFMAQQAIDNRAEDRFNFEILDAEERIKIRMVEYEQALRGGVALINAQGVPSAPVWKSYVDSLKLQDVFPGIQGFAFALRVDSGNLDAHTKDLHAQGFTDYRVTPPGDRPLSFPIVRIEPFDQRNQRAFGYDMFSEPVRRAAMLAAMETGQTAVSGLVQLKQEDQNDPQPGFLMYLPVYQQGMPLSSPAERRDAIIGFVYSPFRAGDLFGNVLGDENIPLSFRLYDAQTPMNESLMYDSREYRSDRSNLSAEYESRHKATVPIELAGRTWLGQFESTPDFDRDVHNSTPLLILLAGGVIDILLFSIITSLARQRQRLAASNEQLSISDARHNGLMNALQGQYAFYSLNAQGVLTYMSPSLPRLLGSENLAQGRVLLDALGPQAKGSAITQAIMRALNGKVSSNYQHEHTESGSLVVSGFNSPVLNAQGELISVEGVVQDITKRRAAEHELELYRKRLQDLVEERTSELQRANQALVQATGNAVRASQAKSLFLANISHEIRTPLNAIMGLNALLKDEVTDPQAQRHIELVQESSRHLQALLEDVLNFSRIESGVISAECIEFDLRDHLDEVVRLFEPRAREKGLHLFMRFDSTLPRRVQGDPTRYRQVLSNLLSNAIKFSERGEISVALYLDSLSESELTLRTEVRDEGIGLDVREFDRLVEPFEQADNTTTRRFGGTGLGLAIAKRLAEVMGGTLSVQSTLGSGSTFVFTVKLRRVQNENAALLPAASHGADRPDFNRARVLVVEDNQLNQEVIKALLSRMNVDVEIAENGQVAIERLAKNVDFELVLMDVHMPVMNGLDATRAIRNMAGKARSLPILALTAGASTEDERACREAGMNDFMTKPVNLRLLQQTLMRYLTVAH